MMNLGIAITTHRPSHLEHCLHSIALQDSLEELQPQILVWRNGERSVTEIQQLWMWEIHRRTKRIVLEESGDGSRNLSRQRYGAQQSLLGEGCDVVLQADDDIVYPPGFLRELGVSFAVGRDVVGAPWTYPGTASYPLSEADYHRYLRNAPLYLGGTCAYRAEKAGWFHQAIAEVTETIGHEDRAFSALCRTFGLWGDILATSVLHLRRYNDERYGEQEQEEPWEQLKSRLESLLKVTLKWGTSASES